MLVQVPFELKQSTSEEFLSVEVIIDKSVPSIWYYGNTSSGPSRRISAKDGTGAILGKNNPDVFKRDGDILAQQMAIFSIVGFLFWDQFDWQIKRTNLINRTGESTTIIEPASRSKECTNLSRKEIFEKLQEFRNPFAFAIEYIPDRPICLPPKSEIRISTDKLVVSNPFCEISFSFDTRGGVDFMPNGNGATMERRVIGIRATVTYFALRAQHFEMPKYQLWSQSIFDGLRSWFDGPEHRDGINPAK